MSSLSFTRKGIRTKSIQYEKDLEKNEADAEADAHWLCDCRWLRTSDGLCILQRDKDPEGALSDRHVLVCERIDRQRCVS